MRRGNAFRPMPPAQQSLRPIPRPARARPKQALAIHVMRWIGAFDAPRPIDLKQFVSVTPNARAYP
ncbi:hypothetical protein BLAT2472_70041 [Burkholderia latens]